VVAGVATADVSSGSGFWIWYGKGNWKNRPQNFRPFCSYFGCTSQCLFIIRESKDVFFYIRGKCVFATIKLTVPVFSDSSLHGIFEALKRKTKKNGGVAIDGPPQGSTHDSVEHSWNRAFCCTLPVLYKVFHLLFKC
jgi:hypothetical protein